MLLAFCLVLLVANTFADLSKCYSCDDNRSCNDPYDVSKANTIDCSGSIGDVPLRCVKVSAVDEDGEHGTLRSCYPTIVGDIPFCEYAEARLHGWLNITCIICNEDLCNL